MFTLCLERIASFSVKFFPLFSHEKLIIVNTFVVLEMLSPETVKIACREGKVPLLTFFLLRNCLKYESTLKRQVLIYAFL